MSLKILADTSVISNQYISSVKLLHPEQEITNDSEVKITTIIGQKENDLIDGSIYNQMVDWMTQKKNPQLIDSFINRNTMIYRVDELKVQSDHPYEMMIEDDEMKITYRDIKPPGKLTVIPLASKGMMLALHYGYSTFFANIQSDDDNNSRKMIVTPPNGMSCQQLTGQDNCSFSDFNIPEKLKILSPSPDPSPDPSPGPSQINVDPYIYPINNLNTEIDFQGHPKEGKYFYIVGYNGYGLVLILVGTKEQLQNSLPILKQFNTFYEEKDTDGQEKYKKENDLLTELITILPDKNGNISLVKNPKGFIMDIKLNDIIVYNNDKPELASPDFKQTLQLEQSGNNFIIGNQPPSPVPKPNEKSSGMSKNKLYAIIFGSIGGVLLIGLILYFNLRSGKKSKKKQKRH